MMDNYTVLYIDDNDMLVPAMDEVAKTHDMVVLQADTVEEGLKRIADYSSLISAIILDLKFPEGKTQGIEGLKIIKKGYPFIPVIVLTQNDSAANIKTAVECTKLGAFDYIGKSDLNIYHLFHIIHNAIKTSRLEKKVSGNLKQGLSENKETGGLKISEATEDDPYNYRFIVYKLLSVTTHSVKEKLFDIELSAVKWHKQMIDVLASAYKPHLFFQLLLLKKEGEKKVELYLTFRLRNKNSLQLDKQTTELIHDLKLLLNSDGNNKDYPYTFQRIQSTEEIEKLLHPEFINKAVRLSRKPLSLEDSLMNSDSTVSAYIDMEYLPPLPNLRTLSDDKSFINYLLHTPGTLCICSNIRPVILSTENIDCLNDIISRTINLPTRFSEEEEEAYIAFYKNLIYLSENCFLSEVRVMSSEKEINQHLIATVAKHFFNGLQNVSTTNVNSFEDYMFSISNQKYLGQFSFVYAVPEIFNVFRMPFPSSLNIKGLQFISSGMSFKPQNLSKRGLTLGKKITDHGDIIIKVDEDSVKHHVYVMGQTGTGKSTLLKTMIEDCINLDHGCCIIDPHGDLFDEVKKITPDKRKKDLISIDTYDLENSLKINLLDLESNDPKIKNTLINELIHVLNIVYDLKLTGGPIFETVFRNSLLLAMDDGVIKINGIPTLNDVYRIIHDDEFRKTLLSLSENQKVKDDFKSLLIQTGEASFNNFKTYISSKINFFTDNHYINTLFNSKEEGLRIRTIIDTKKILLIRLDKGHLGLYNLDKVGMILLNRIVRAIMSRSDISKEKRESFFIFIDEFQNFLHGDMVGALSEVRKYNCGLVLANQTLGQLNDAMIQSLLGNVGSTIFFRPGLNDYEKIKYYFEPQFTREEVLNLANFHCIARITNNNIPGEPFVFQTKL